MYPTASTNLSTVSPNPLFEVNQEDPFIWRDSKTQYFHALLHTQVSSAVGRHAFSVDGVHWTLSNTAAYTSNVTFDGEHLLSFLLELLTLLLDGTWWWYQRRERPQLYFDPETSIIYFLTKKKKKEKKIDKQRTAYSALQRSSTTRKRSYVHARSAHKPLAATTKAIILIV